MKRINKSGFGKIELMTMLGLIAILLAIGSKYVVDNGKNYKAFKNLAATFANNVAMYKDNYPKSSNIYYLYEVIEKGYSEELKNPINTRENCDIYESFVEVPQPSHKKVTLVCGDYIVEGSQNDGYIVYEVSAWSETKNGKSNDNGFLYNYMKDGEVVLSDYVSYQKFIALYFDEEKNVIESPFDVEYDGYELLTKKVYREKTLVKEIK